MLLEEDELQAVQLESARAIDIERHDNRVGRDRADLKNEQAKRPAVAIRNDRLTSTPAVRRVGARFYAPSGGSTGANSSKLTSARALWQGPRRTARSLQRRYNGSVRQAVRGWRVKSGPDASNGRSRR